MSKKEFKVGDYVFYRGAFGIIYRISGMHLPIKVIMKSDTIMYFEVDGTHSITIQDKLTKITKREYLNGKLA